MIPFMGLFGNPNNPGVGLNDLKRIQELNQSQFDQLIKLQELSMKVADQFNERLKKLEEAK